MASNGWSGIFPIPVTPFATDGTLDIDGLHRQVDFCVASGAHGIVYPGVVSEFFTLTEEERREATRVVFDAVDGRVPFIGGVASTSIPTAAAHATDCASIGATGVMASLPYVKHFFDPDFEFVREYYRAIADANLPIVVQNARIGHVVAFDALRRLIDDVPLIRYLKQETFPSTHAITDALDAVGDRVDGVFGGLGSIYLTNELQRGACGSMPAPPFVDVIVRSFDAFVSGNVTAANAELRPLAPLFTMELLYNVSLIKTVLTMRGVIGTAVCRIPVPEMDDVDRREIEMALEHAATGPWEER